MQILYKNKLYDLDVKLLVASGKFEVEIHIESSKPQAISLEEVGDQLQRSVYNAFEIALKEMALQTGETNVQSAHGHN